MKFLKPVCNLPDLLQTLKSRGLLVSSDADALSALENIGYYRLAGYAYPFLEAPSRQCFKPGTTWEQISRLYEFDRELRVHGIDGIERVEVSVRARLITASCAHWNDPHWFLDARHFHPAFDHNYFMQQLERELGIKYPPPTRNRVLPSSHAETFIQHYYTKYGDPYLPPFWMTAEVLTLGTLSKLYKGLGDAKLKAEIAKPFGVPAKMFEGWIHALAHLRNICAHHGRLWNRVFSISPPLSNKHLGLMNAPTRLEGHLVVLVDCLNSASFGKEWQTRFLELLADFPEINPCAMGFATTWNSHPFWKLPIEDNTI
jgi:abortive infection bacteriophage resistance protein